MLFAVQTLLQLGADFQIYLLHVFEHVANLAFKSRQNVFAKCFAEFSLDNLFDVVQLPLMLCCSFEPWENVRLHLLLHFYHLLLHNWLNCLFYEAFDYTGKLCIDLVYDRLFNFLLQFVLTLNLLVELVKFSLEILVLIQQLSVVFNYQSFLINAGLRRLLWYSNWLLRLWFIFLIILFGRILWLGLWW